MPLDPQIVTVMEAVAALGLPPNNEVSPEQARINGKMRPRAPGPDVAKVEDRTIPGPGGEIPGSHLHSGRLLVSSLGLPGSTAVAGWSATWIPLTERPATCALAQTAW